MAEDNDYAPQGDPLGRRVWRQRAAKLSEAAGVARLLNLMLEDAGMDAEPSARILDEIVRLNRIAVQRSQGRVEPRRRFKGNSSHPILEDRAVNHLYVDESGQSNPEPFDRDTFFALGAVAIDDEERQRYCERADAIKRDFFGTTEFTFHEPDMRRRNEAYFFGGDGTRQREFDSAIKGLIAETDFKVFGVGIRKAAFKREYADTGIDPYLPADVYAVAIVLLLERYVDYLANTPPRRIGRATFESQGPREDAVHQMEYARALIHGSQWLAPVSFRNWLETGLRFAPKRGSEPTELADMVARTLYEWVRGGCEGNPDKWEILSSKIHCRGDGRMGKFGIKIFPDHDIRDKIELHRRQCGAA